MKKKQTKVQILKSKIALNVVTFLAIPVSVFLVYLAVEDTFGFSVPNRDWLLYALGYIGMAMIKQPSKLFT